MKRKQYSDEFKKQVIQECQQVGNIALVAHRHELHKQTVYSWIKSNKQKGSIEFLPKKKDEKHSEIVNRLEKVSTENDMLKKLVVEKRVRTGDS